MVDTMKNLRDCRHYATLLCAARIMTERRATADDVDRISRHVRAIYLNADPSAWPMLDAVKRVMEIDTEIDGPGSVLLLAGIDMTGSKRGTEP
jgi:hypothetical protein